MEALKWWQSTIFSCLPPWGRRVSTLPGRRGRAQVESWHLPSLPPRPRAGATFVVMPDPQLAEVAQTQHVGEVERVCVVPLKLVPVGWLLQGQGPTVPILPKDGDEHIGISACSWVCTRWRLWVLASPNTQCSCSGLHPDCRGRARASSESRRPGVRSERAS